MPRQRKAPRPPGDVAPVEVPPISAEARAIVESTLERQAARSPRLERVLGWQGALPEPRKFRRRRPRRAEPGERMLLTLNETTAARLRHRAELTGEQMSAYVERAVAAALDADGVPLVNVPARRPSRGYLKRAT